MNAKQLKENEAEEAIARHSAECAGVRKVLVSPGYGAGWSTWESDPEMRRDMLFDARLIAEVERQGNDGLALDNLVLKDFLARMEAKYGHAPYEGGARDLKVVEVEGQFKVDEYDGFESLALRANDDAWI